MEVLSNLSDKDILNGPEATQTAISTMNDVYSSESSQDRATFEETTKNREKYNEYKAKMPEFEELYGSEAHEFDEDLEWYNSDPLYFEDQLKNKLVLLDFWTSCCCDCLHLLPVLEKLEKKFKEMHGVSFIGVHSGKFDAESDSFHLKKNILKYGIEHPVINDASMQVWKEYECYFWPTVYIIAPNKKIIKIYKETVPHEDLEIFLEAAYDFYFDELNHNPIPMMLEREKEESERASLVKSGSFFSKEKENAIKSNLRFPHKIAFVSKTECPIYNCDFLVVSDMGNNRLLIINEQTYECIETIGSGKEGHKNGKFKFARFNQPFGTAYYENCLYICDGKNHMIRKADLVSKTVSTVAGTGIRGEDPHANSENMLQVNLSSPFDIIHDKDSKSFYIAMSGIHQIWKLDLESQTIKPFSGTGVEGCHDDPQNLHNCTWAQPCGVSIGQGKNGAKELFVADSESSSIRAINMSDMNSARTIVGGDGTSTNLFSYGDSDGHGTDAKYQHPMGLLYIEEIHKVLAIDSYNHKLKLIDPNTDESVTIFGTGDSGLTDGSSESAQFAEPTDVCYKFDEITDELTLYICDSSNDAIRKLVHKREKDIKDSCVDTILLANVPSTVVVVKSNMVECGENGCRLVRK